MEKILGYLHWATRLLLPNCCVLCGCSSENNHDLCAICESSLPWNRHCCRQCAVPLAATPGEALLCGSCQQQPPAFQHVIAPLRYEFPVDQLVNGFKHKHRLHYGQLLAALLQREVTAQQAMTAVQVIIPVPLHWRRQFRRGFNQSDWVARRLARYFDLPVDRKSIVRTTATPAQQGLTRQQRLANLKQAFRVNTNFCGVNVALVDDVVTTGTTANCLATLLKQRGAAEVQVWSLARTPTPGHRNG